MNLRKLNSRYGKRADSDYWDDDPNHPANNNLVYKTFNFVIDHHFITPEGTTYADASEEELDSVVTNFMTDNFSEFDITSITTDEVDDTEFFAKIVGTVEVEVDPAYDDDPREQTEQAVDYLRRTSPLDEMDEYNITIQ